MNVEHSTSLETKDLVENSSVIYLFIYLLYTGGHKFDYRFVKYMYNTYRSPNVGSDFHLITVYLITDLFVRSMPGPLN